MNELLLLRHAKSSWDDPSLDDFDRPLAPRGRKAAKLMGQVIAEHGWRPGFVLVSAALRARQTWQRVAAELGSERPDTNHDEALYMASADQLLDAIRATEPQTQRLMVIGHNPGMETLALGLAAPASDAGALNRMRKKFPTAALASFTFGGSWKTLGFGTARLTHFLRPKDYS